MGPHIDPLAVVRLLRPGQATAWVERAAGDGPTPVIGVREESRRIRRLPPDAPVELRAGVYTSPAAIVIPLLLRIGPERSDAIYEIWVNAHSTDFGLFDALAHGARVVARLYGDDHCKLERTMAIPNSIGPFFREARAAIAARPAWPMDAFDRARATVEAQHDSVWGLWLALAKS